MNENQDLIINVNRKQTEKLYVWINQVLYTYRTQDYTGFEFQNLVLKNEVNRRRSWRFQHYLGQNGRNPMRSCTRKALVNRYLVATPGAQVP